MRLSPTGRPGLAGRSTAAAAQALARRDRLVVLGGLLLAAALAWLYLIDMALDMASSAGDTGGAMTRMQAWRPVDGLLMFAMWAVMMVAMMLPGAAPMILIFARVDGAREGRAGLPGRTGLFASGYVLVWAGFSTVATAMQWGLQSAALLSPMMVSTSAVLGGALFLAAGVYQWTPLKYACLRHCRSPLSFVMRHWRPGAGGALRMGIAHGAFCLGCCGFVMGLLFVGGVMNLAWVAAVTVFVVAEKIAPRGQWVARAGGGAMIAAGAYLLMES